jgi:hypothetical protein
MGSVCAAWSSFDMYQLMKLAPRLRGPTVSGLRRSLPTEIAQGVSSDAAAVAADGQSSDTKILPRRHVWQGQHALAQAPFQKRARHQKALKAAFEARQAGSFKEPSAIRNHIAGQCAGSGQLLRNAGKPPLENLAATGEEAMDMTILRHTFAMFTEGRKSVPFEHRDLPAMVCQNSRGQKTAEASADHQSVIPLAFLHHLVGPALTRRSI